MAAGFNIDNLIVSRTTYNGVASLINIGQTLSGSGSKTATADGSFPNVFKNEVSDPSFGVTSSIYLDQFTSSKTFVNTMAINNTRMTTSFASK